MASTDARPVPRKNVAFRYYFAIRKNDGTLITTWAGQDSEVSKDGGNFTDCTNEATEIQTSGCGYIDLTDTEMNADSVILKTTVTNTDALPIVVVLFPEESGDMRADAVMISGDSTAADNCELMFDGTGYAGGTALLKVDLDTIKTQSVTCAAGVTVNAYVGAAAAPGAANGLLIAGSNSSATFAALTCTGQLTVSNGVDVSCTTGNKSPLVVTGNGTAPAVYAVGGDTGHGVIFASGTGSTDKAAMYLQGVGTTSRGLWATGAGTGVYSTATDGHAVTLVGAGAGAGLSIAAGATGNGLLIAGGGTSGDGIRASATDGDGMQLIGGTNGAGLNCDGAGSGDGISATGGATGNGFDTKGGATSGSGIYTQAINSGDGITSIGDGNGHGISATGAGSGDGMQLTAGATGVDLDADLTDGMGDGSTLTACLTATGFSTLDGTGVENAVWDAVIASHADVGSTGAALAAAGGSGDPWSTAVPGAYGAGTAGYILGTNLNATVSSRSSHDAAAVVTALGTGSTLTACVTATGFSTHSASDVVTALGTGSTLTACVTATGFSTLDAAGIRTAVGLTLANLDTQLGNKPTAADIKTALEAAGGLLALIKAIADKLDSMLEVVP